MHIIQLDALEPGVYNDHYKSGISEPPEGWAMIPDDMALPRTFPRLGEPPEVEEITYQYEVEEERVDEETGEKVMVKVQKAHVILTVTKMTEGTLPALEPPEPTNDELQWQAITDLEIAQMEYDQALTDLEIAQLEG